MQLVIQTPTRVHTHVHKAKMSSLLLYMEKFPIFLLGFEMHEDEDN